MTEYVEIPVTVFETQKELLEQISGVIRDAKDLGMSEEESMYIIYKDGSKYFIYDEEEIGKFKRYGIKAAVYEHVNGYEVYGDFAVTDNGDISIDESDIEEYGVYAGQYDVKEQEAQEVQEAVEQTVETIAEGTSEVETTEQAQAEENKDTFEYRNYIISGNERTGIIAIDNHGNFSPKVYKTVEEAKKAVDEDIEYAEKKYAEMEAEQTEVEETAETETEETIKTTAERQKDKVIIMTNKEMQAAVENWYMNGKPSSSYFTMNGEKYAVLPRYGTSSNEFDVFKVKTFTIGKSTHHYPYYDPETREPIDRIAVVTIPDELIAKKETQIAEEENNNALFEDFFKEV